MNFSLRTALVTSVLAAGLVLTGCSLPGSPVLVTANLSSDETTNGQTERSASVMGSRLCVINNSTSVMSILWRGYPDARDIPPGGQSCNSGYETSHKNDVSATISYVASGEVGKNHELHVAANNNWLWPAEASAVVYLPEDTAKGICRSFDVGQTRFVETGLLRGDMTRINDSADNKEFVLILTDKTGEVVGQDC